MSSEDTMTALVQLMQARQSPALSKRKPAFWLGAGCSVHDGVPLNAEMLKDFMSKVLPGWGSDQFRFDCFFANTRRGTERVELLESYFQKELKPDSPYHALVEIVQAGYIDLICTFNIDNLIDQALHAAGLREFSDYLIIDAEKTIAEAVADEVDSEKGPRIRILKVHGDYRTGYNAMTSGEIVEYTPKIRAVVEACSDRVAVVCGYSFFHLNVLTAFSKNRQPFFYVNRNFPDAPMVLSLMESRSGRGSDYYIDQPLGLFGNFVSALHLKLGIAGRS